MRAEKRRMYQHQGLAVRACLGFLLLFLAAPARSQDIGVNCSQNATCQLTPSGGVSWANGNLTWIFKPINPHVSIYIFIRNYNPTSSHSSQTVTVWQSPFSKDIAPSLTKNSSRWTQDTLIQNSTLNASCNAINAMNDSSPGASGLGSCYVETVFAAQVAIQISGAVAQAGSPDNFDLAIVQETGIPAGQTPSSSSSNKAPIAVTGPLQPATTKNTQTTSGTNAIQIVSIAAIPGQRVYLFGLTVFASAAPTCTFGPQVKDGVAGTSIFLEDVSFIGTAARSISWPVPLASSVGNGMDILIAPCGAGITTTVSIQASQL